MSPIDAGFISRLAARGVLERMDAVAVHGFPLDWNHWQLNEWPAKLRKSRRSRLCPSGSPKWASPRFGAEEVQEFGLRRTFELLAGQAPRIHWYCLFDLPRAWPATTRHREAEGSCYYRHFYMGLLREDGTPKRALRRCSHDFTPALGICQWFHFEDHRLDDAVRWLRRLGVRHLRTGLSWADSFRPRRRGVVRSPDGGARGVRCHVTFCFTPEHRGIAPHHTSPPVAIGEFAEFCARMVRRYAPGLTVHAPQIEAAAPAVGLLRL